MPLHPQAKAALDLLAMMPDIDYSKTGSEIRAQMEAAMAGPSPFAPGDSVVEIENLVMEGPAGKLQLRVYRPSGTGPFPITVYFHGGGFVFGTPEMHDNVCRCLANRAKCLVVSVDYRLAPEAKFPAAIDDAFAALRWIHAHAGELGGNADRLAVSGDSAGGNLAAVVAQLARGAGPQLCHQLLLYPVTDCRFDTESYQACGRDHFLTTEMMRWYWQQYLPSEALGDDPRASPLRQADCTGLPCATIITAEFDPLRDEGEAYGQSLEAAGVAAEVHRWPGQIHGFMSMLGMIDAADEALSLSAQSLRRSFNAAAAGQ